MQLSLLCTFLPSVALRMTIVILYAFYAVLSVYQSGYADTQWLLFKRYLLSGHVDTRICTEYPCIPVSTYPPIFSGCVKVRASDISWKKKLNFAGFSGANLQKNRLISRDFCGKKVKICSTIGRFRVIFEGEKSKFAEKSAHFAGF